MEDKRLFLLDAYALIFRGYYAFIKNPRINSKGINTSAVLGFTNSLLDVIKRERPTHLAVVFDVGSQNTIRHDYFPEYKANRDETPEGIKIAVPYIHKILEAMHIPIMFAEGYEADDVIGTLAQQAEKQGFTTYMMTPDKDFAQLVTEHIKMYKPASRGGGIEIWGIEEVKEKFGVNQPNQIIDYLGMMGDSVDNIPGIPGIGPKTASKFIQNFGSMEGLYQNTHQLKGKQKEKVEANKEQAFLSKKLATILTDAPVTFHEKNFNVDTPDFDKVKEIFADLEFKRLLENLMRTYGQETPAAPTVQKKKATNAPSLFDFPEEEENNSTSAYKTLAEHKHWFQTIDSPMALDLLLQKLNRQKEVAFSIVIDENQVGGIGFCYANDKVYFVPMKDDFNQNLALFNSLKPFFENNHILKISSNVKLLSHILKDQQIELKAPYYDTKVAHYVLNPDMKHDIHSSAENHLKYQATTLEQLLGKGRKKIAFNRLETAVQRDYCGEQAAMVWQLKNYIESELKKVDTSDLLHQLEFPLIGVLAKMERNGIKLDVEGLAALSDKLKKDLDTLEKEIYQDAEQEFNINSPKQLGEILFGQMQLVKKPKKTRTGQYATSEDILQKIKDKHPIIAHILSYRQLQKLKSTYVDALPNEVNPKTQRVHTVFAQTVAATGRLASNNPNLQNIPIRTERGREVRKAFVAKDENHVLLAADYSQIELRLIAGMSGDEKMLESFRKGEDIHTATAARVFNVPISEVSRTQRSHAKTVNFGIIYGVSAFGLSEQTGLSRSESKNLIELYFETYPGLKTYINSQIELARKQGYVETIMGRRRYLRDILSGNHVVRTHAERNAVNAPIQGSAADIIKKAMIQVNDLLAHFETQMLLQVHDELVFEVPKKELETIQPQIKNIMENAIDFAVPLVVDCGIGNNWLEAH